MLVLINTAKIIMGSLQDCHGTDRVMFASVAMGVGIDLHGVNTTVVLQTLLKTISKVVVEEGEVEILLTP